MREAEREVCVLRTILIAGENNGREVISGSVGYDYIDLPNVKDEPRSRLARLLRQQET